MVEEHEMMSKIIAVPENSGGIYSTDLGVAMINPKPMSTIVFITVQFVKLKVFRSLRSYYFDWSLTIDHQKGKYTNSAYNTK